MLSIKPQTHLNQYVVLSQISNYAKNCIYKAYIPSEEEAITDQTKFYIIKAIPFDTEEEKADYNAQAKILPLFNNVPSIMKINETFTLKSEITGEKQFLFAVMDFCEYIDLYAYYSEQIHDKIPSNIIRSIAFQALKILKTIHQERVIHHDIKPANFLVESLSPFVIKITDFEFSVKLSEDEFTTSPQGTIFYMAPELLDCQPHDMSIDIWSLGFTLYELTAQKMPFNIKEDQPQKFIIRLKVKNNTLTFDNDCFTDPNFIDLLSKMLEKDHSKRITAEDALKHPYFNEYDNNENSKKKLNCLDSESALEQIILSSSQ